jgi:thioredoxin-dependent peroxiredoxin
MSTTDTKPLAPLVVGTPAPAFSLPATGNQTLSLADYAGKALIIVFYPKDKTPGCTKQLCALSDEITELQALNAAVVASNPGSLESHERFVEAYNYQLPILVDADKTMAAAYQALKPEGGIQRTVYVVDAQGIIRFAQQGTPSIDTLKTVLSGLAS